jgi:WD40 repeat protein
MVAWRGEMKIGELWDYDNGKQICELTVPNGEAIIDALFVPDSDRLLTTHTNTVALWNSVTGELLNTRTDKQYPFEFFGNIQHPFFIDDGARLVTIKRSGASIWDTATGEPTHRLSTRPRSRTSVILGNRPNTLLTVTPGGSASLWDLESGEKLVSYRGVPQDITTARNYIRFSKNGERLLLRHRAGQAIICWDARTGKQVERWFLVNHGNDVLIENSITGEYVGSPAALRAVVAD